MSLRRSHGGAEAGWRYKLAQAGGAPRARRNSSPLEIVRAAVAAAYAQEYQEPLSADLLTKAVEHPLTSARAGERGTRGALAIIFTEYPGLSQYARGRFWTYLQKELDRHGLYYEWLDGGAATVWAEDAR